MLTILFDLFYLSFVQLVLATVLVLSPVREMGNRARWTGSRITEIIAGGLWAAAITAVACLITHEVWGEPLKGLVTGGYALVALSLVVMSLRPDTNVIGQVFYASYASAAVTFAAYAAFIAVVATTSVVEIFTASLVILLDVAAMVVWMSNVNYMSDVMCRARRSRPLPEADRGYQPFVSVHIPAHNEPPELLIQTIQAVERIDYPNFEIIVIDNNTKDPTVWRPVEEYCRGRARLKFIHVDPWPGYKAGACNLALRQYTDPRAEIIALVDADDIVQPYYLRETAPYFADPSLGFIQTFEGNRDYEGSAYYTACVDSFQAFYLTIMSSRNERDSLPFVGTMGLFRRSALTAVGGWNEWCICEDTEASLRVAKDGWSGLYIPRCFGRGVVPPSFAGMLTQRHRWCFGAMQILRLHWRSLMPWDRSPENHLTIAQRRDYLMASLGWFRDLFMLTFSLLLLAVTGLLAVHSRVAVAPVDGHRSLLPVSLIIIATVCMQWTLRHWTTMSVRRTILSLVMSLSVTWVVALACIEGVARKDGIFLRTAKAAGGRGSITRAIRLTRAETILAVALFVSTGLLLNLRDRPWVLIVIVFCQACVYLCGPVASVWNLWAMAVPREEFLRRFARQRRLRAGRRRTWSQLPGRASAAMGALCVAGVTSAFIAPVSLLPATAAPRPWGAQYALLDSDSTRAYLKLGRSQSGPGRDYYPITSVRLSATPAHAGLTFSTSSLAVLADVLRAAADGRGIRHVSLVLRSPGRNGQPASEVIDTFAAAAVSSFREHLSGVSAGTVSLALAGHSRTVSATGRAHGAGPLAATGNDPATARVDVTAGPGTHSHAVSAVALSEAATRAPVILSFRTASTSLLEMIAQAKDAGGIPILTLSVRSGHRGGPFTPALTDTLSGLSVGSLSEDLAEPVSGRVRLLVRP